jgi:hypothetical protein
MFDFSPAGGLKSVVSSFSKTVFSDETIRRVAMFTLQRFWIVQSSLVQNKDGFA